MCTRTYDLNNEKKTTKEKNIIVKDESKNTKIIYENQTCKCNIFMSFFHETKAKKQDNKEQPKSKEGKNKNKTTRKGKNKKEEERGREREKKRVTKRSERSQGERNGDTEK